MKIPKKSSTSSYQLYLTGFWEALIDLLRLVRINGLFICLKILLCHQMFTLVAFQMYNTKSKII